MAAEVGQAVAESGVARKELFLTTKVWNDNFAADRLVASLEESLAKLRTDYVDLALIHWPLSKVPVEQYINQARKPGQQPPGHRLQLSAQDMADIAALERNGRMVNPEGLAPAWD